MKCKICSSPVKKIFTGLVLKKYQVKYYQCSSCHFIFTQKPHWYKQAYQTAVSDADTGIIARNMALSRLTAVIIHCWFNPQATFVDYAGGYGILTRLMRDLGFNYRWLDPYCQNIFAQGFEYRSEKVELLTAFEVFEHFVNPVQELKKTLGISHNILFTTELQPTITPQPSEWWYYAFNQGQHISLYSQESLQKLADGLGLNFYTNGTSIHLFTKQRIPQLAFSIVCKLIPILFLILRRRLPSRTFSDHQLIK